jgi:hypothetical protein
MRYAAAVAAVIFAVSALANAQNATPKPQVSSGSLTSDEAAVYRAVFPDYVKGSDGVLNVADRTVTLSRSNLGF